MYIPKRYGQSRADDCPFCGEPSSTTNKAGVPVCRNHKNSELGDMKCVCGETLDLLNGKWGPYFRCLNCGNISFKKVMEVNNPSSSTKPGSSESVKHKPKEICTF